MGVTVEKLVAQLEARIDKYEKSLAKARQKTNTEFGRIEKRGQRMEKKLSKLGKGAAQVGVNLSKGLLGGLVAGGIAGSVAAIGQIADQVARVGDEAKRAGVDVEAFQELKYVAEQNRIGVDALTDGLKEMNLRADEFIATGKGSSAEAFQRLGYSAEELNRKLAEPSKLFTEIIGKLKQFDQAAQIRIADEIFGGTGGEQFVQLIEQGEDGLKRTIDEAHRLGNVMSDETIKRADELNRKFDAVATTVGNKLKQEIIDATSALGGFLDSLKSLDERSRESLEAELKRLESLRQQPSTSWGAVVDKPAPIEIEIRAKLEEHAFSELKAKLLKLQVIDSEDGGGKPPIERPIHDDNANAIEREAKAVRNLIAALEFEKSLVGVSARQQEIMNTLRKAGAGATEDQRQKIATLVAEIYDMEAAQEQANQRMAEGADLGKSFFSSFANGLRQGKSLAESLLDAVNRVVDRLLDASLDALFSPQAFGGGNPLVSFFSMLLGNGRKEGGFTGHGSDNDITGVHHANEFVMNAPATRRLGVKNLEALQNGTLRPRDMVAPNIVGGSGGAGGGQLDVSVGVSVENGNLIPTIAEVSGQVADRRVRQTERDLGKRIQKGRLLRENGFA